LVQDQGGAEFLSAGILKYVEDLKGGSNTEVGPKDYFEMTSIKSSSKGSGTSAGYAQLRD
jgi:hypothetical protein